MHSRRRPRTATRSKRTSQPPSSGCAASQASAARRIRRTFSAVTISAGSPNDAPDFDFTSQTTSSSPRRATRSSSFPATQTFVASTRYPRRRYHQAARRSAAFLAVAGLVAARLERAAVDRRRPPPPDDRGVRRGDVADVRAEAVARVDRVRRPHVAVARHLRDDRGGGDRGALLVAVDDRAVRGRARAEAEAVDEAGVGRLAGPERLAQAAEVRAVEPVPVDHGRREDVDGDPLGAGEHRAVHRLARLAVELLRVVQERERPGPVVAEPRQVEQDAGDHERAGERPPPGLVRPGDEAHAEPAVEREQLRAGPARVALRLALPHLAHPGLLAHLGAEVVELRAAHVPDREHLDPLDLGGMEGERALDPDPEGVLADGERLAGAGALPLDHDPLERLDPLAVALDHLEVDAHGVARLEAGDVAQLAALEILDDRAHRRRRRRRAPARRLRGGRRILAGTYRIEIRLGGQ